MAYRKQLERFQQEILEGDGHPSWIAPHPKLSPRQQLAIYSNGYRLRLFAAVSEDFPHLRRYFRDAEMDARIKRYIESHPPTHYSLHAYSLAFGEQTQTSETDSAARALATFETASLRAFWMENSPALLPEMLSASTPEPIKLAPRRASLFLSLPVTISAFLKGEAITQIPEYLCVFQDKGESCWLVLEESAFQFLQILAAEPSLEAALHHCERLAISETKLQQWFSDWTRLGLLSVA